jgi:putative transcriptional regulator
MSELTKFGSDLVQGLSEALAYLDGKPDADLKVHHVEADRIDPKTIRQKLRLSQDQMARVLGTSTSGYRKWEQGQRQPTGAARTLLRVMEREPEAVLRALASAR